MEIVKWVKHLSEAKYPWKKTWAGLEWAIWFWIDLHCLYGASCLGSYSSCWLPTFGLTRGASWCAHTSFSQDGFQYKVFWEADRTYYRLAPPPFPDPWGVFLCMCDLGGLLDALLKCVLLIFYSSRILLLSLSLSQEKTGDKFQLLSLGPRYLQSPSDTDSSSVHDVSSLISGREKFFLTILGSSGWSKN